MLHHTGPHGEALALVRKQREQGKSWARAFIVVSMGRNVGGRTGSLDWLVYIISMGSN